MSAHIPDIPPDQQIPYDDWHGNNAAFTCPFCKRAFLVSGIIDRGRRVCPRCIGPEKCIGICTGSDSKNGKAFAYIEDSEKI